MSLLSYYCTLVYTMLGWLIFALLPATIWLFQEPGQLELAPARSLSAVLLCGTLTNNLHCSELSVNGSPPFCLILIRLKLALNNVIAIKNIVHNDLYKNLKKKTNGHHLYKGSGSSNNWQKGRATAEKTITQSGNNETQMPSHNAN